MLLVYRLVFEVVIGFIPTQKLGPDLRPDLASTRSRPRVGLSGQTLESARTHWVKMT